MVWICGESPAEAPQRKPKIKLKRRATAPANIVPLPHATDCVATSRGGMCLSLVNLGEKFGESSLLRAGFTSAMVPTAKGALRVFDAPGPGNAPPVVVLHGLGGSAATYAPWLHALRPLTRRILAIDLPNHGKSFDLGEEHGIPATPHKALADIEQAVSTAVLKLVPDEPAVLWGHSTGGYLAMVHAAAHPTLTAAVIAYGPDGAPRSADDEAYLTNLCTNDIRGLVTAMWPRKSTFGRFMLRPFVAAIFAQPRLRYLVHSDAMHPVVSGKQLRAQPAAFTLVVGEFENLSSPDEDPAKTDQDIGYFTKHLQACSLYRPPHGHADVNDATISPALLQPSLKLLRRVSPRTSSDCAAEPAPRRRRL